MSITVMSGIAALALSGAGDFEGISHRLEVTPEGAKVVRQIRTGVGLVNIDDVNGIATVEEPRWVVDDGGLFWVGSSVSVGDSGASIFAGKELNNEGVALFSATSSQPIFDFSTLDSESPVVDVADRAPRAVAFAAYDTDAGPDYNFEGVVYAFDTCGDGTPLWTYTFPTTLNYFGGGAAISDDGNVVVAWKANPNTGTLLIEAFDGAGNPISSGEVFSGDQFNSRQTRLSDDGSRAYFFVGTEAIIWDVINGVELFRHNVGGSFDSHAFSGDGKTFAYGFFGYWRAYRETSPGNWTQVAQQNFTGSTFISRLALDADGSTLAYQNQQYSPGYDRVEVGMFDIDSNTALWSDELSAPGSTTQLAASGVAVDDNGDYMVAATWGDSFNATPEVVAYNRAGEQTAAIDARGSAFGVDIDPDGDVAASVHKGVHANDFGNGGDIIAFDAYEQTLHVVGYPQQGGSIDLVVPAVGDRVVIAVTNRLGESNTPYGVTEVDLTSQLTRIGPLVIPGGGLVRTVSIPNAGLLSCNDIHLQGVIISGRDRMLTNKVSLRILPN